MLKYKYYILSGILVLAVAVPIVLNILDVGAPVIPDQGKIKKEDTKKSAIVSAEVQVIMQHFKRKEIDQTIDLAEKYLKSNPGDPTVNTALAEAYLNKGNLSAAETAVKKAMETSPDDPWSEKILACVYREKAKNGEPGAKDATLALALEQAKKSLNSHPRDIDLLTELAQIYLAQGNNDAALQTVNKALAIAPHDESLVKIRAAIGSKKK